MSGHTPGPWKAEVTTYGRNHQMHVRVVATTKLIGSRYDEPRFKGVVLHVNRGTWAPPKEEQDANAALIAAAPELLAVLERAVAAGLMSHAVECPSHHGEPCYCGAGDVPELARAVLVLAKEGR